ncbi:MAG: DMT family transporter [Dongiaceae bacterium]
MNATEWLLVVALALLWGGSFFLSEIALRSVGPMTVVLGRIGLAAPVLLVLAAAAGQRIGPALRRWDAFLVMGALNNAIPFSLIVWGQTHIDSGLASILNATTPLFTFLLAHAMTRDERLTPSRAAGVALGFGGVVLVIGPQALDGLGLQALAEIAILAAALSYAGAGIYGRRFRDLPPLVTAAGMVTASTLIMTPLVLVVEPPGTFDPTPLGWLALAGLALLCTVLAYMIYFRVLATAGATNLLLVTFLIPPSALVLGVAVLGERPAPTALLGMALIFFGLAAIDGRFVRYVRRYMSRR